MSNENSTEPVEDSDREEEIVRTMKILIAWIALVVFAGLLLILFSDPFAALFSMLAPVV
ncbi:hypothetical protein [Halopiger goleimassiliensis]|uniref:hypothetical protein n=1 Tax=Halopiger goleimassiliensis TaxID=1293048 RepID=UPI000A42A4D2|nr:hypothetical protein [Halopiger goleimassiliensis]